MRRAERQLQMSEIESTSGIRKCVQINGENYYLFISPHGVSATVPHENWPERMQERLIVETICGVIDEVLSGGLVVSSNGTVQQD